MNQHSLPIDWLLDSDPAIRWQVLQDLLHAPPEEIARERARVAGEGWGAHLLGLQPADGAWGGAAWNRGWDSTMHVLMLLREFQEFITRNFAGSGMQVGVGPILPKEAALDHLEKFG